MFDTPGVVSREEVLTRLTSFYLRPDLKLILEQIRRSRLRLRLAMSAVSATRAGRELLSCWQSYAEMKTLAGLLHEHRASDPQYLGEVLFFISADSQIRPSLSLAFKALRDCRFREEILPQLKPFNLQQVANWADLANERILPEFEAEQHLILEDLDWQAQSRIFCLGQRWPLAAMPSLLESPQRSIRRATYRGIQDFIRNHEVSLNQKINDLLDVRNQMMRKLHLNDTTVFAMRRMGLWGVTIEQATTFFQSVQNYFVPMGVEIRRLQRKRLNLETLAEHDWLCFLQDGHPVPAISRETQFNVVMKALASLLNEQSELQKLVSQCLEQPLIDFQLGPDMYGEAKADLIHSNGPVYWRLAHHGTMADISHQLMACGPLLATLANLVLPQDANVPRVPDLPDMARRTLHACLTEWIAWPLLSDQIQESELYRLLRLSQWVEQLVFLTMSADFSIRIHRDNLMDSHARYQQWLELERLYLPDLEHEDWPFMAQGGGMHLASEAWLKPGQSLAKAMGLFSALSFWQKVRKTPDRLNRDWGRLIALGNQLTFEQLLKECFIPLPWEEASFKQLAFAICAELSL